MTQARFPTEQQTSSHKVTNNKKPAKPDADESVATRVYLLNESKKILTSSPKAMVVGSGYGTQIGNRLTGIEMSFLDIWVEQGIIGVILWLLISLMVFFNFNKSYQISKKIDSNDIAIMACTIALLLLTNINPFINNPIGISFLLFALVVSRNELKSVKL